MPRNEIKIKCPVKGCEETYLIEDEFAKGENYFKVILKISKINEHLAKDHSCKELLELAKEKQLGLFFGNI